MRKPTTDSSAERIRELTQALSSARQTILKLAPVAAQPFLEAGGLVDTFPELHDWERWCIEAFMHLALPGESLAGVYSPRAPCPLCDRGSLAPYSDDGFAFPIGLERHLKGTSGSRRCPVFAAAWESAVEEARAYDRGTRRHRLFTRDELPWTVPIARGRSAQILHLKRGPAD